MQSTSCEGPNAEKVINSTIVQMRQTQSELRDLISYGNSIMNRVSVTPQVAGDLASKESEPIDFVAMLIKLKDANVEIRQTLECLIKKMDSLF